MKSADHASWFTLSVDQALKDAGADPDRGLSSQDVLHRRSVYGLN